MAVTHVGSYTGKYRTNIPVELDMNRYWYQWGTDLGEFRDEFGVQDGDLLIMYGYGERINFEQGPAGSTPPENGGWTKLFRTTMGNATGSNVILYFATYYKWVDDASALGYEGYSYNNGISPDEQYGGGISAFRGVDVNSPFVTWAFNGGSRTSSGLTSTPGGMYFSFHMQTLYYYGDNTPELYPATGFTADPDPTPFSGGNYYASNRWEQRQGGEGQYLAENHGSATLAVVSDTNFSGHVPGIHDWGGVYSYSAACGLAMSIRSLNQAPLAPSSLLPGGLKAHPIQNDVVLTWTFNDPNPGDAQSAYEVQYRKIGAPSFTSTATISSGTSSHAISGSTLLPGDYEWKVRVLDVEGAQGPFSSLGTFSITAGGGWGGGFI